MKSNKIFRLSSLRTSIHIDGCNVTHYQELHKFSAEAEAVAFFNESIQELLSHGWYDIESIPVEENNKNFTPDELYGMFLELKNQVDKFANTIIKPYLKITPTYGKVNLVVYLIFLNILIIPKPQILHPFIF